MPAATLKVHKKETFYFDGVELTKAREALGLTQEQFAIQCDWSQANQTQLELPGIEHHFDFEKREKFARLGIRIVSE